MAEVVLIAIEVAKVEVLKPRTGSWPSRLKNAASQSG